MNKRKVTRLAFSFAFALFAAVTVNAQEKLPVLDSCVDTGGEPGSYWIRNECGVRIHAYWGFWDHDSDSGIIQYSKDLDPGETIDAHMYTGFYAIGCPFTPKPGHPYGYKLVYASNLSGAVTSVKGIDSLTCIEW
jgi:hypothetical protein